MHLSPSFLFFRFCTRFNCSTKRRKEKKKRKLKTLSQPPRKIRENPNDLTFYQVSSMFLYIFHFLIYLPFQFGDCVILTMEPIYQLYSYLYPKHGLVSKYENKSYFKFLMLSNFQLNKGFKYGYSYIYFIFGPLKYLAFFFFGK